MLPSWPHQNPRLSLTSPFFWPAPGLGQTHFFVGLQVLNISQSFLILFQNDVTILVVTCVLLSLLLGEKLDGFFHWTGFSYKKVGLGDGGWL